MKNTLFGFQPITSISFSNDEIIQNIMLLHNIDRFDLDCTYSVGHFWKNLPQPKYKSDLLPKRDDILEASSDNLPFKNQSMKSIMFDPPFVIDGTNYRDSKKGSGIIPKRFEGYKNFDELKNHYFGTLKETYRLLKDKGILIFKCQDIVSSGKNHFTHCLVMEMAMKAGYYPKDLFILMAKNRINSFNDEKWKNQYHARKHHCYFWVFQKVKCKVNYSFR
jgi:hypothetical protein